MTKIKRYYQLNEEFIGTILKGALGKVFSLFTQPFKDLANDIKKSYKENDPNSIKSLIVNKLNQSIDSIQKGIQDKDVDEGALKDMMNQFIKKLTELAGGMTSDFEKALGKEKFGAPSTIAKAILIGNKESGWGGVIGLLSDPKYKYSKVVYETLLAKTTGDINAKKNTASKFFDGFQKDFVVRIQRDFTDEEIRKIFDESQSKSGKSVEYKVGDLVKYKRKGYDNNDKPENQADMIAQGELKSLTDDQVTIFNTKLNKNIIRNKSDILGKAGEEGAGPNAMKAKEVLGAIKNDEEKMANVVKFAQFISDENNKEKLPEIEKIIGQIK